MAHGSWLMARTRNRWHIFYRAEDTCICICIYIDLFIAHAARLHSKCSKREYEIILIEV